MRLASKRIVFRADASLEMGSGHVMRCLTLADALREQGAECHFVCRAHPGHLADLIAARGHRCHLLAALPDEGCTVSESSLAHAGWLGCGWEQDAAQSQAILADWRPDWLVVDHYALDARWERLMRPHVGNIMAIDDLADRAHECDLLLDQNLGRQPDDYQERVPSHCTLLVGPRYALLRPEFAALREYSLTRRQTPTLKQLLITMGGVDQPNATGRVLEALQDIPLPEDCRICVVMGEKAPWLAEVETLAATMPWPTEVRVNVSNMAELMADSDLAIGAAGGTAWERCCLGLPTFMLVIADNQREVAHHLLSAGTAAVCMLTDNMEVDMIDWLHNFISAPQTGMAMLRKASSIIDGLGIWRVADSIVSFSAER
ncbi:UDP-2,4-diacetamido-2,4,6-trideoxy-beta-L-altropyranose hydrolase [compost metagenome]